jgi:hypothetical protein
MNLTATPLNVDDLIVHWSDQASVRALSSTIHDFSGRRAFDVLPRARRLLLLVPSQDRKRDTRVTVSELGLSLIELSTGADLSTIIAGLRRHQKAPWILLAKSLVLSAAIFKASPLFCDYHLDRSISLVIYFSLCVLYEPI